MFGMQYLIAGSYAMLTESHVRVDIFYARFSRRGKAITDLLTSVFFFIFAGTLLATGFIFASDSMQGSDWSRVGSQLHGMGYPLLAGENRACSRRSFAHFAGD